MLARRVTGRQGLRAVRFEDADAILADPGHPQIDPMRDALNFATLVEVAASFSDWHERCRNERDQD